MDDLNNLIRCLDAEHGENFTAYNGDCVDVLEQFPANCIDLSIYSPPFANLYIYSESAADMGNCANDEEFFEQYCYLIAELLRTTKPGRLSCVHSKNLVNYKGRDGMAGMRDFRGEIIRAHVEAGWAYHSEVTIWKDPVIEMQRTKAHGLLWKQLRADSTFSRMGMPEYITVFRKWPKNAEEEAAIIPVEHTHESFPVQQWQQWASPVWMDIQQTNVLNTATAREAKDEKHICPLQLDVIERCVKLWSNPGDTICSPFMGIGSEGYQAVQFGRKFFGCELKPAYFKQAVGYLKHAQSKLLNSASLFDAAK